MFKNYIFDFGQVIVKFDTKYMTSVYISDQEDICLVEKVVFDRIYWDKLDAGTITDEEVKEGIKSRLPERLQVKACTVYDNWYHNLPFVDGIQELLCKIKSKGGRLFLLSNISKGFAGNYIHISKIKELFDMFDGLVFSAPIGMTKPSKEIFNYVINKYNLKADETVFIDDNENNILGAQNAGLSAFLFNCDSVKALEDYIFQGEI